MTQAALNRFTQGLVSAAGTVTLNFPDNPGQGIQWQFNANVINSPTAAEWSMTIGLQQIGNWVGAVPFGPCKAINQDFVSITGSGLQPGLVVTAQITGWVDIDDGSVVIPNNVPQTANLSETTVLVVPGITQTVAGGFAGWTFNVPPSTRRLTVLAQKISGAGTGNEQIVVIGSLTGEFYSNVVFPNGPLFCAVEPQIETSFIVSLSGGNSGDVWKLWVVGAFSNPASYIFGVTTVQTEQNGSNPLQIQYAAANANQALAVNGTATLIPAPGLTLAIYIFTAQLEIVGAGTIGTIEPIAGGVILQSNAVGVFGLSWAGAYKLPLNTGLQLNAVIGGGGSVVGIVTYTIGNAVF